MSDIFAELEAAASDPRLQRLPTQEESKNLTELALELIKIDKWLNNAAVLVAQRMERKTELQMRVLPDAMDAVGQDVIGMGDQGVDLKLEDYFKAALPNPGDKDKPDEAEEKMRLREEGIAFLTEDAPDLLSTTITITLPKGSLEKAQEIVGSLTSEQGFGLEPGSVTLAEGVHWATLTAWLKDQVRNRKRNPSDFPLPALGATIGRIVKIVKRKTK